MASQDANFERAAPKAHRKMPAEVNILLVLVGIALIFEVLGWIFQGQSFLGNIGRLKIMILQVSVIGIIAVGVTQVIISGGIDLSSGSVVGAVAMVSMSFAQAAGYDRAVYPSLTGLPVIVPVGIGLLCGAAAGFVNGWLIAYTKIPPFIATLGMMLILKGLSLVISGTKPIYFNDTPSFPLLSTGSLIGGVIPGLPVPNGVVILFVLALIISWVLNRTVLGRYCFALGSNEEAVRLSGVNADGWKVAIYALAGGICGIAGLLIASRLNSAQPALGLGYELDAIAAVVIGGTSLAGGRGSILGTIIGAHCAVSGSSFWRNSTSWCASQAMVLLLPLPAECWIKYRLPTPSAWARYSKARTVRS